MFDIFNGKDYTSGLGDNSLAKELYFNAGSFAQAVGSNSAEIWNREDTAYQRMVADMKKAGLNPWTGINSGGSQTSSTNPSMDSLSSLLGILGGILNYDSTNSQSNARIFKSATSLFDSVIGAIGKII